MGPSTTARWLRLALRILAAAISVSVVALTALGWYQLRLLDRSTPVAPVIAGPPPPITAEQNILLAGLDSRTDAQGDPLPPGLLDALHAGSSSDGGDTTDTLMVVHIPAGGGRATAISIPRDSYVDLADGLGRHKINSAYSRASAQVIAQSAGVGGGGGMSRPSGSPTDPAVVRAAAAAGARATIGSVEALTGLHITHYAAVDLAGFAALSQAIGGVPVCLRAPASDPYSGVDLPAGPQTVEGAQALAFVRQRHGLPNGDLDRIARQQVFLAGTTEKLLSTNTLADPFAMSRLSAVVARSVTLDAGWDVLGFVRQLHGLSGGSVTFRTIPTGTTDLPTPDDGTAVAVTPSAVRTFVADAIAADAGRSPVPTTSPAVGPRPDAATAPSPVAITRPLGPEPAPGPTTDPAPTPPPITAAAPGCVN